MLTYNIYLNIVLNNNNGMISANLPLFDRMRTLI